MSPFLLISTIFMLNQLKNFLLNKYIQMRKHGYNCALAGKLYLKMLCFSGH